MNNKFAIQNRINEAETAIQQAMSALVNSIGTSRPMKQKELNEISNQLFRAYLAIGVAKENHKRLEGMV